MPKKKLKVEIAGEKKALVVSWRSFWRDIKVEIDGKIIGQFENNKAFKKGRQFNLQDGSTLFVQLVQKGIAPEVQVHKDGQPLAGSASDPETRKKTAYNIILFLAGLNFLMAAITLIGNVERLNAMGYGVYNLLLGILYIVCVGIGWKKKSFIPLVVAFILFIGDAGMAMQQSIALQHYNTSWIVVRFIIGTPIFLGIKAAWKS